MFRLKTSSLSGLSSSFKAPSFTLKNTSGFSQSRKLSDKILNTKTVTLLPGDGIGPELTDSVVGVFQAARVPLEWEKYEIPFSGHNMENMQHIIASISRNRVVLKGPLFTPISGHSQSVNLHLRKTLDVYANVVECKTIPGLKSRYSDVPIDIVIVRENTQGEYSGFEQQIEPNLVQSLKVITEPASRRVAQYAFEYAVQHKRRKITCIHKANIQKATDGLFLEVCRDVAKKYPDLEYGEMIIDNASMQLVMKPSQFDVMLTPNLYGNVVINVACGLTGGPGVTPGFNYGSGIAMFESGARHVGKDIAGKNIANPTAYILAGCMMLRHLGLNQYADKIQHAVHSTIKEGKVLTRDMHGSASTTEFTREIIEKVAH